MALANAPTLVALFSDINAFNPEAQAWARLREAFRRVYVPGMHLEEYQAANTAFWRQFYQMLEATGLSVQEVHQEVAAFQHAVHVEHAQIGPPPGAWANVPPVPRRMPSHANAWLDLAEASESDDEFNDAMDQWMAGADAGAGPL